MNPVATQQVALDNSLVAPEKRLKIEKCNARIAFSKLQREETYQVTLDALRLSPCYPAFLITAKVPEIYMHQFWTPIKYVLEFSTKTLLHHLQKKNWLHSFRNLAILASVIRYLQFILIKCTSLGEHLLQSSIGAFLGKQHDLIDSGNHEIKSCEYGSLIPDDMINQDIKDSKAYKTYYDFSIGKVPPRKARRYKKVASPSRKLSLIKEAEPVKKAKRVQRLTRSLLTAANSSSIRSRLNQEVIKRSRRLSYLSKQVGGGGICPRILNQDFIAPPPEEELVTFIQELGYSGKCNMLSAIHTDQMHQPWRTFAAIINRFISGKRTGLDRLRESRAQILWGMYNKKNVDYVALLWEDFMYQADNREISSARNEYMPYLRFTKTSKILKLTRLTTTLLLEKVPPRKTRKYKKVASPLRKLSLVKEAELVKKAKRVKRPAKKSTTAPTTGVVIRDTPGMSVSKKKAPAKADRSKGIEILFDVALSEAAQLKEATKRSKKDFHISQASGSGDGTDFELGVLDEQQRKTSGIDEGTGTKPGVPNVPKYQSESDDKSWGDSEDDNDDINDNDEGDDNVNDDDSENEDDDGNDAHDSERIDSDDDDENPSFTLKDYDEEEHDEEYESDNNNGNVFKEEDDDLYKDVDVRSLGAEHEKERKGDEEMTDADQNVSQEKSYEQVVEDAHVTLTSSQKTESSKQSSSVSSDFVSKFMILDNVPPVIDEVASMMNVKNRQEESSTQAPSLFTVPETAILETSVAHATTLSQLKQADHSAQLPESLKSQLLTMVDDLLNVVEKSVKDIISNEVKSQLPQILPKVVSDFTTPVIQSTVTESLENVVLAKSSSQPQSTYEAAASLTRNLYDALVKSYQLDKDLFDSYGKAYSLKRIREDKDNDEDPPAGPDQGLKKMNTSKDVEPPKGPKSKGSNSSSSKGNKSQPKSSGKSVQAKEPNAGKQIDFRPPQTWISSIAKTTKPPLTFDELMNTPIDFFAYIINHLKIDNLTQQHRVGTTFNLLKGTCKSRVELEYHFKECYKAVTGRLDWTNPEGHQYPFDLSKPLLLIDVQGRQVVPADYFINNDLEYLKGGSLSRKYTTSTTKTRAAKYDNIWFRRYGVW
ncbi:hypothetical protein Tco_1418921 [Tanacetum coccineum]